METTAWIMIVTFDERLRDEEGTEAEALVRKAIRRPDGGIWVEGFHEHSLLFHFDDEGRAMQCLEGIYNRAINGVTAAVIPLDDIVSEAAYKLWEEVDEWLTGFTEVVSRSVVNEMKLAIAGAIKKTIGVKEKEPK